MLIITKFSLLLHSGVHPSDISLFYLAFLTATSQRFSIDLLTSCTVVTISPRRWQGWGQLLSDYYDYDYNYDLYLYTITITNLTNGDRVI